MPATLERKQVKRKFAIDVPFTKGLEAESGDLELTGYASTWVQDRDGDYMDPKAFDDSLEIYLSKNPILLWQHNMRQAIGQVLEAKTDETGLWVRCLVVKPESDQSDWKKDAYHDVKRGIVRTFSVGGYFTYDIENWGEDDEKWIIAEVELLEISVVSIPSNPDSIFEAAVKAFGDGETSTAGDPQPARMAEKAFGQMLQILGVEDMTDPALLALDERGLEKRYAELSALYERVNVREAPAQGSYRKLIGNFADLDLSSQLKAAHDVRSFVAELHAPPARLVGKAGRVLSKANEDKLVAARDAINEVLDQLEVDEEEVDSKTGTCPKCGSAMNGNACTNCEYRKES